MEEDLLMWKWIVIALITVVTALAMLLPRYYSEWFFLKERVSSGNWFLASILISNSLMQMLAESESDVKNRDGQTFPWQHLNFLIGFMVTLVIQVSIEAVKDTSKAIGLMSKINDGSIDLIIAVDGDDMTLPFYEGDDKIGSSAAAVVNTAALAAILSLDTVLAGLALAVEDRSSGVIVLGFSILASDWIESMLYGIALYGDRKTAKNRWKINVYTFGYILLNSLIPAICVVVFTNVKQTDGIIAFSGVVKSLLAGSFMYMGCVEILAREIMREHHGTMCTNFRRLYGRLFLFASGTVLVVVMGYIQSEAQ